MELIRGKAASVSGVLVGFLSILKGLPTGYNKDLQEDKTAVFSVLDNVRLSMRVLEFTVQTVELKPDRMNQAAADSFMGATDLADFLVTKGVPFRVSHEIVARAVRSALEQGRQLHEINLTEFSPWFAELPPDYLVPEKIVARKSLFGGTGHR